MSLNSPESLVNISPQGLRAFLEENQWQFSSRPNDNAELWQRNDHEILLPLNTAAVDYVRRLRNFVEDLARESGHDEQDVTRELLYLEDDVVDFRLHEATDSVALTYARSVLDSAKGLAVASACSAITRKSYHGRSKPRRALEFADAVRMGHTRHGSFVIPMISPVGSARPMILGQRDQTIDLGGEAQFFPRRATGMMADVLKRIYELAVIPERIPPNEELSRAVVVDGVSADACAATAEMLSVSESPEVDVSFHWALTATPPRIGSVQVKFPAEAAGAIEGVGKALRSNIEVEKTVLYGFVSSLDRDPGDPTGTVKVRSMIGNRVRPIKVTLNDGDYHTAAEANDLRVRVIVTGSLITKSSGFLTMPEVNSFRIDDYIPFQVSDDIAIAILAGESPAKNTTTARNDERADSPEAGLS